MSSKAPPNIYVCERGFVLVGRPREQKRGEDARFIHLDDCGVVRSWGTTDGLGELAMKGPLPGTKIDREPDGTQAATSSFYRIIPCDQEAWAQWPPLSK